MNETYLEIRLLLYLAVTFTPYTGPNKCSNTGSHLLVQVIYIKSNDIKHKDFQKKYSYIIVLLHLHTVQYVQIFVLL